MGGAIRSLRRGRLAGVIDQIGEYSGASDAPTGEGYENMSTAVQQASNGTDAHKYVLENFFDKYFTLRDAAQTLALVTDDVYSFGTGAHEVAHNKEELTQLTYSEMEQLPDPIGYNIDTYQEKMIAPGVFGCICDVTACIELENQSAIHYTTRLTAGFRLEDGKYLAYHFHMSEASAKQKEMEFFPLHYGEAEARKINTDEQIELIELMKRILPGGAMGGYVEPGFPLYFINDELLAHLGYTYDEFVEDTGKMVSNTMHPDDEAMVENAVAEAFAVGNEYTVEYRMKKKDHSYIWVRDIGRKIVTPSGRVAIVSVILDITDERLRQQTFEKTISAMKKERRRYDRMTGLLNREPAEILIEQHLLCERSGAFFLMDIDDFKLVNDIKGHPVGDQVLHTLAGVINKVFPESAVKARLGGDEFVVFLKEAADESQLRAYAEKLIKAAKHLIDDEYLSQRIGISIGIAVAPEHGMNMNTLYSNADKSLYYTKRNGKNGYSFFGQPSRTQSDGLSSPNRPSMDTFRRMIKSVPEDKGALLVEFDTFRKICGFALRNSKRFEHDTQLLLFSIQPTDELSEEQLKESKAALEQSIRYGLRTGDLLTDFSPYQLAVMLINCPVEDVNGVAERVLEDYRSTGDAKKADVVYASDCLIPEE